MGNHAEDKHVGYYCTFFYVVGCGEPVDSFCFFNIFYDFHVETTNTP